MEQFTFVKGYKTNEKLRKSFNGLATDTFGIDFEPWYKQGFWNERYICYSYIDKEKEKVVSNVSINLMDMIIEGEVKRSIQIGTVMTHPDYRKKGLASNLMKKVFADYEEDIDLFFLFADEENFDFYSKHGFKRSQESEFKVEVRTEFKNSNLRKLSISNEQDKQLLMNAYASRITSNHFDTTNAEHILAFYGLYVFEGNLYYLENLDAVVIFENEQEKLHLYGLFCKQTILFDELINYIATEKTNEVVFHFTPNFEDLQPTITKMNTMEGVFHIRSSKSNSLPTNFKIPQIAHA